MNEEQKMILREQIEQEVERCWNDIERLAVGAAPVAPDKTLGRLTRMESLKDQGISNAALSRHREKLFKLEQTLEQIERPGFGDCAGFGNPIRSNG